MLNFNKYLPHLAVVNQPSVNEFGDSSTTSPATTACFYYYGPRARYRNGPVVEELLNHYLLIPSTCTVVQDSVFSGIVDANNILLVSTAKVRLIERFNHWRQGHILTQVTLELN